MLDSVTQELREHEAKSAKALTDFRATRDKLNTQLLQCRSYIIQCVQARTKLITIPLPDLRQKFLKLTDDLRKHENYFENLKDVQIRPYFVVKIEGSQTREELSRWSTRLKGSTNARQSLMWRLLRSPVRFCRRSGGSMSEPIIMPFEALPANFRKAMRRT